MTHTLPLHKGENQFYISGNISINIKEDGYEISWEEGHANVDFNGTHPLANSNRVICSCDPALILNNDEEKRYARQVIINLPKESAEYKRRISENIVPSICVDSCIAGAIYHLWEMGIETTGCCCGHNVKPPWVQVIPEHYPKMFELGYDQYPIQMVNGSPHALYAFYL